MLRYAWRNTSRDVTTIKVSCFESKKQIDGAEADSVYETRLKKDCMYTLFAAQPRSLHAAVFGEGRISFRWSPRGARSRRPPDAAGIGRGARRCRPRGPPVHLASDFKSGALPLPFSRHSISFSRFPHSPFFGPFSLFPRENGFR